jgi:hypothetical protein
MQIMADKGILKRDESQMKHIYHVAEEEQKTKDHLLDRFINSVYQGSAGKLVMQLLGNKKASKDELDSIRKMLDQWITNSISPLKHNAMSLAILYQNFTDQLMGALCNMLIHSLWQGLILAAVAGLIVVCTKKASPTLRYNLLVGALLLFVTGS